MLQVERRRWNWPDEIRHQSQNQSHNPHGRLSLLFDILPSDRRLIPLPGGNCIRRHPPTVRSLPTSFTNAWPHDHPSRPEGLNSQFDTSQCSFRSARVYHSAAITNADLSPFVFRPFPSKDSQLWSLVRARRRIRRRPIRLDPPRKVPHPSFKCSSQAFIYPLLYRKISKSFSFFPLKDSYGTTQLVAHHDRANPGKFAALSAVPPESVVLIQGRVRSRPDHSKRPVSAFTLIKPSPQFHIV